MKGKYLKTYKTIREKIISNGLIFRIKYSNYLKKNLFSINARKKIIYINKNIEITDKHIEMLLKFLKLLSFQPRQVAVTPKSPLNEFDSAKITATCLGIFYLRETK